MYVQEFLAGEKRRTLKVVRELGKLWIYLEDYVRVAAHLASHVKEA